MEKKGSLAVVFLVVVIDLLGFGLILPLLPRYAQALNADKFTIGVLTGVFSLMQFLVSPLWGQLSDRIGRRPVLLLGLAGSTLFYALFAYGTYVGSLPLLFLSRIGAGIAGATIGTAHAYIADVTPPEKRTGGMALVGAAFGIGFTFGPLLGALALINQPSDSPTVSHWPGVWAAGLSFAALVLALFRLPESRQPGGPARARKLSAENLRHVLATPLIPALILAFFAATLAFSQFESTLSLVL
ncbi:MAG TPA: MFS transporter, partial [Planctomycetia bacterium]|nr:MFS transporter [Planctomycetia bacterium]